MRRPLLSLALAVVVSLGAAACAPGYVRDRILEKPGVRVELRHQVQGGKPVPRGFAQPATISDVRIAHILASLTFDDGEGKQAPVVRSEFVYDLAEGIEAALAKATPDDEVAAASFPQDKRLGIFTDVRVTAFRLALVGDEMRIEVLSLEQPLEREGGKITSREYDIPTELPTLAPRFKLVPGKAQTREGARGLNVAWRDPYYRKPSSLSFSAGQARRRTVLMELPPDEAPAQQAAPTTELPPNLSDLQLRALDQLDEARRGGQVTEADYQRRRRLVLENRLEEAGFGSEPR